MRTLGLLLIAGCGTVATAPVTPPVVAPPVVSKPPATPAVFAPATIGEPMDWSTVRIRNDDEALAVWRKLGLTGATWELSVAEIPDDALLVQSLAMAQLRAGNWVCPSQAKPSACLPDPGQYDVPLNATFDDPCLQRELALWSLAQLEDPDLVLAEPLLTRLVSVPGDLDLAELVVAIVGIPPSMKIRLIAAAAAAGNRDAVGNSLGGLDDTALREIATTLHVEEAYQYLELPRDAEAFLFGIADPQLKDATRVQLASDVVEYEVLRDAETDTTEYATDKAAAKARWQRLRKLPVARVLEDAVMRAPSSVAAAAADLLGDLGHPSAWNLGAKPTTAPAAIRRLRMLAFGDRPLTSLLATRVSVDMTIAPDPSFNEPDQAPEPAVPYREVIAAVDVGALPFSDELLASQTTCDGSRCTTIDGTVVDFTFQRSNGKLVLAKLELTDPGQCGVVVPLKK